MRQSLGGLPMKYTLFLFSFLAAGFAHAVTSETEVMSFDRSWQMSFFSLASEESDSVQRGGARTSAYNYVSVNFKVDDNSQFAVRLPFMYQTAGFDDYDGDKIQGQSLSYNDPLIDYTVPSTLLPGEIEVYSRARFEIPLSKSSIDQKKIGGLKFDFIFSRYLAPRWELEYWPTIVYNINSATVYLNEDTGKFSNTKSWELDHRLTAWYRASEKFSLGFFFGGEDTWYNRSKENVTTRGTFNRFGEHNLKLGPSIKYTWTDKISFIANVADNVPLWGYADNRAGKTSDLGKFRPENTEFVLLTTVNF